VIGVVKTGLDVPVGLGIQSEATGKQEGRDNLGDIVGGGPFAIDVEGGKDNIANQGAEELAGSIRARKLCEQLEKEVSQANLDGGGKGWCVA
jgi:hypothetical protein